MSDPIQVWRFHDAPEELRNLSQHGGDEDWLALIPADLAGDYISWMESDTAFGVCGTDCHYLPDGREVRIGAHS